MYVVVVLVQTKPGTGDRFAAETLENARATRQEPANLRFDVLRAVDDPDRFTLYEAYRDAAAFAAHQQTPHYLRWREAVKDLMAVPRQGLKHQSLFFGDAEG